MNGVLPEPFAWSARKRWLWIGVAIAAQFGLLFWLSARSPRPVRVAKARPVVRLVPGARGDWLSVADPTLFSRAHRTGFSGPAWLGVPPLPEPEKLPESAVAPAWLTLSPESLGGELHAAAETPPTEFAPLWKPPPPAPTQPAVEPLFPAITNSVVQVEGALAARGLLSLPALPSWSNADVLAPSQVQVMVDARGNPVSALLLAGSGLKGADEAAVRLALAARFGTDPAALDSQPGNPAAGLIFGRLLFRWHTLPVAAVTNNAVNPP
jgi:hypothetical protein